MKYLVKAIVITVCTAMLIAITGCTKESNPNDIIPTTELSSEELFEDILGDGDPIVFPGIPMEDSWDDDEMIDTEIVEPVPNTSETVPEVTEKVTEMHGKESYDQNNLPAFSVDAWEDVEFEPETPTVETESAENNSVDPPTNEGANNLPEVSESDDWEQESSQDPTEEADQEPVKETVTPPEETRPTDPATEDSSSELPGASSDAEW